jgi:hypothetical protein
MIRQGRLTSSTRQCTPSDTPPTVPSADFHSSSRGLDGRLTGRGLAVYRYGGGVRTDGDNGMSEWLWDVSSLLAFSRITYHQPQVVIEQPPIQSAQIKQTLPCDSPSPVKQRQREPKQLLKLLLDLVYGRSPIIGPADWLVAITRTHGGLAVGRRSAKR